MKAGTLKQVVAYASPAMATAFILNPVWSILPGVYAKDYGFDLALLGSIVLIARVFDAITDPVIGYLSDRRRESGGKRGNWVLLGGSFFVIASSLLYMPTLPVSEGKVLFFFLLFFLSYTIIDIPHYSWGSEISTDYDARAYTYSIRTAFVFCGQILFYLIPLVTGEGEYNAETLRFAVFFGAVLMAATLFFSRHFAPDKARESRSLPRRPYGRVWRLITGNLPLLIFVASFLLAGMSLGMWWGLQFIYLDSYLKLGDKIPIIFITGDVAGLLAIPLWFLLVRRTSKRFAMLFGIVLNVVMILACLLVSPGVSWLAPLVIVVGVAMASSNLNVVYPAMVADIADYGELKFRRDVRATYFAVVLLTYKCAFGAGSGLALYILGRAGFDPAAGEQDAAAILGLQIAFVLMPVLLAVSACVFVALAPISKARHSIISKRLNREPSMLAES
ncbi:MFS transporter [Pseudohaliea sp.]|uniref:MFS transporter n=1 Tax=Pseudohaliea sp. TaxID=2740289 RepID=UPI0032F00806